MFDRFIRLAKARRALRDGRLEDALQLGADPLIRSDRRSAEVCDEAARRLLGRARQRLADGDWRAAQHDLRQLRDLGGPTAAIDAVGRDVDAAAASEQTALDAERSRLDEARRLAAAGELAAADAVLAAADGALLQAERRQVQQQNAERQKRAAAALAEAEALLTAEDVAAAGACFGRALALDRAAAEGHPVRSALALAAGRRIHRAVQACGAAGDAEGAAAAYREALARQPWLATAEALSPARAELQAALQSALRVAPTIDDGVRIARVARDAGVAIDPPAADLAAALQQWAAAGATAGRAVAVELQRAAAAVGAKALAAAAGAAAAQHQQHDDQIAEARARIAAGELEQARSVLTGILVEAPMHETARRDLDLVGKGIADLDQRLAAARAAARDGQLRQAAALAMALGASGRIGAEAQLLAAEVRARMQVVDRGLDEVRVALHGRTAATIEGVRHSLRRLEELAKVQQDHEELPRWQQAVAAEIEGLERCEAAAGALERQAVAEAGRELGALCALRSRLLAPDRLDARLFDLLDRTAAQAELALAAGRLADVEVAAGLFGQFAAVRGEFAARQLHFAAAVAARRQAAAELVDAARAQLADRDLAEAERLAELAQAQCGESAAVRALAVELATLRRQADALARVEALATERDFQGAQKKLAELPPTPALLRTRIFDMKQNLARAQGLEGAFLLRIDEGGEHLVLRGETVSIGNVRQTRADLPVLANLAGRHASIRRSMSFHGGMQDAVVAEEGEVRVGGRVVPQHRLVAGDKVQLGPSFGFVYQQPSVRSLSVGLVLQGGFQVAGTDRVLLMKDRGRDGRLLIGPGQDVHVRVPNATGEVEVFAAPTGQLRVACDDGGTIDGAPFRGEHPVSAGQVVEAAGVSFVLLPWRPSH